MLKLGPPRNHAYAHGPIYIVSVLIRMPQRPLDNFFGGVGIRFR